MKERLIRVHEFAFRLGLEPTTVRAWIHDGKIRAVRVGSRAIRIPVGEFDRIIKAGMIHVENRRADSRPSVTA